jgi:phage repressor protein C with HTH and peptisase S24 domain
MEREICERFTEIRKEKAQNKQHFADFLEIPSTTVSDIELGKREPSKDVLLKLTSKCGINLHWMLTGDGEKYVQEKPLHNIPEISKSTKIPLLNQNVSCGEGIDWLDEQNVKGYVDIFSTISRYRLNRLFAFPVQGNSMVGAGIKNGDYVLFDTGQDQPLSDDIYVFSLDGEVFCKQLEFDKISKNIKIYSIRVADLEKADLLRTLNIEEVDFTDRFHIFGRVFCWVHPNFEG